MVNAELSYKTLKRFHHDSRYCHYQKTLGNVWCRSHFTLLIMLRIPPIYIVNLQNLYVLLFCFPPYTWNSEDTVWKTVQVLKSPSTACDTWPIEAGSDWLMDMPRATFLVVTENGKNGVGKQNKYPVCRIKNVLNLYELLQTLKPKLKTHLFRQL